MIELFQTNQWFSNNYASRAEATQLIGIDDPTKINSALLQLRSGVKAFRNSSVSLLHRGSLEAAALSRKAPSDAQI